MKIILHLKPFFHVYEVFYFKNDQFPSGLYFCVAKKHLEIPRENNVPLSNRAVTSRLKTSFVYHSELK